MYQALFKESFMFISSLQPSGVGSGLILIVYVKKTEAQNVK